MIDSAIEDGKDPQNDQIAGFSVEFLLAGYDTTSTALSYTSYLLAMNTDVQERLQTEIDEFFEEHPVNVQSHHTCMQPYIAISIIQSSSKPLYFVFEHRKPLSMKLLRNSSIWTWSYKNL
jgi:cytochrome P450